MTVTHVTTAQFARILMNTAKHRRKVRPDRYELTQKQLAAYSGWNALYVVYWETGRMQPTLQQALDCLGGTV